jgi:HAD superfamily hydrolase (TIGR01490 family)
MSRRAMAIFDLDGTLACGDTFVKFTFGFLIRHPIRLFRCMVLPVVVWRFARGLVTAAQIKERVLIAVLGGVGRDEVRRYTDEFLDRLILKGMSTRGLEVLEEHRKLGDILVLLSASPDIYVRQLGQRLGFHEVICTEVKWNGEQFSGELSGLNIKGEEKVQCFLALRKRCAETVVVAYADNMSDLPLLRAVDVGVLVNGSKKVQQVAMGYSIRTQDWSH